MKHIIKATDLLTGEYRHYTNLHLAALDIESPFDLTYEAAKKARNVAAGKEHPQAHLMEGYKRGYPFESGDCRFEAIPVYSTGDCTKRDKNWSEEE